MLSWLGKYLKATAEPEPEPEPHYEVTMRIPASIKQLEHYVSISKPQNGSLQELINNSEKFPKEYPVKSVLSNALLISQPDITKEILEHHANSTYPLLHESALQLYTEFLKYKVQWGSMIEKSLYADMTVSDLVQRILEKRALAFCGHRDYYELLSGETGISGWETTGTDEECLPLILRNCLSYDEIKLSAFLSVTSYSVFLNDGNRRNRGIPAEEIASIERHGIVIGMHGPRLGHGLKVDSQEIIVAEEQNTSENGYGKSMKNARKQMWHQIWANFYGVPTLPLYEEVVKSRKENEENLRRYKKIRQVYYFDNELYAKRITIAAETLLLEAESRAAAENKKAFVHVVGIGLGAWLLSAHQDQVFLDSYALCLRKLISVLPHISDVNFSWFKADNCGGVKDGEIIGEEDDHGIRVHFNRRPPHAKLDDPGKMLVVSYAWDPNAFPGNEYWLGSLETTGDPANACSTQVTELHNAHVNRRKVCGANLHIASRQWGILHISDYYERLRTSL